MLKRFQKFNRHLRDDKNFRNEVLIIIACVAMIIIGLLLVQCDICGGMCHCR